MYVCIVGRVADTQLSYMYVCIVGRVAHTQLSYMYVCILGRVAHTQLSYVRDLGSLADTQLGAMIWSHDPPQPCPSQLRNTWRYLAWMAIAGHLFRFL